MALSEEYAKALTLRRDLYFDRLIEKKTRRKETKLQKDKFSKLSAEHRKVQFHCEMMTTINLLTGCCAFAAFFPSQTDYFLNHSPSSLSNSVSLSLSLHRDRWDCLACGIWSWKRRKVYRSSYMVFRCLRYLPTALLLEASPGKPEFQNVNARKVHSDVTNRDVVKKKLSVSNLNLNINIMHRE